MRGRIIAKKEPSLAQTIWPRPYLKDFRDCTSLALVIKLSAYMGKGSLIEGLETSLDSQIQTWEAPGSKCLIEGRKEQECSGLFEVLNKAFICLLVALIILDKKVPTRNSFMVQANF